MMAQITIRDVLEKVRGRLALRAALRRRSMQRFSARRTRTHCHTAFGRGMVATDSRAQGIGGNPRFAFGHPASLRRGSAVTVIVDMSVLVAVLVGSGREGQWAETVVAGDGAGGPELTLAGARNALCRLERTGEVSRLEATNVRCDLLRFDLALFHFAFIAVRVRVTSYDVLLAEPLVRPDRRSVRVDGTECQIAIPPWVNAGSNA